VEELTDIRSWYEEMARYGNFPRRQTRAKHDGYEDLSLPAAEDNCQSARRLRDNGVTQSSGGACRDWVDPDTIGVVL
jgi:hypothetical protein